MVMESQDRLTRIIFHLLNTAICKIPLSVYDITLFENCLRLKSDNNVSLGKKGEEHQWVKRKTKEGD